MSKQNHIIHLKCQPTYPLLSCETMAKRCSDYGPIGKSAYLKKSQTFLIHYMNDADAQLALKKLQNFSIMENEISYIIEAESHSLHLKRKCNRIILRNLCFYANKNDVIKKMEDKYGKVIDIHLPVVPSVGNKNPSSHRGFGFVVFDQRSDASKAIKDKVVMIKKRECKMEFSENKSTFSKRTKKEGGEEKKREREKEEVTEEGDASSQDQDNFDADDTSLKSHDENDDLQENKDEVMSEKKEIPSFPLENAVFLRNLSFDVTRNEIQEIFSSYGEIEAVYLNKDSLNQKTKGSAFLYFKDPDNAQKLFDLEKDSILLKERPVIISKPLKISEKNLQLTTNENRFKVDRRNLYLRIPSVPSRPNDDDINIPQSDKDKRKASKRERKQKLGSPLFFLNPYRLSIRNLSKSVTVISLRHLIIETLEFGLKHSLVNTEDVSQHLYAQGLQYTETDLQIKAKCVVPAFDNKKVNYFFPSIQIVKEEDNTTSKGFAFVQFRYHVHALAVLRQLDNNVKYTELALGGKKASLSRRNRKKQKIEHGGFPRLIVEFVIENKAKMQKQEEKKQRIKRQKETNQSTKKKSITKRSRGGKQREQKRKAAALAESKPKLADNPIKKVSISTSNEKAKEFKKLKGKPVKPPSKKKDQTKEEQFDIMVQNYKKSFFQSNVFDQGETSKEKNAKRWFDE